MRLFLVVMFFTCTQALRRDRYMLNAIHHSTGAVLYEELLAIGGRDKQKSW